MKSFVMGLAIIGLTYFFYPAMKEFFDALSGVFDTMFPSATGMNAAIAHGWYLVVVVLFIAAGITLMVLPIVHRNDQ